MSDSKAEDKIKNQIKNRIIYYLSKRDYSKKELKDKIKLKIEDSCYFIDDIIDKLEQKGYISDVRFSESFIRYRRSQLNGKLKIKQELKYKGVKEELFKHILEEYDDWFNLAYELKLKKYGYLTEKDYALKNKQIKYIISKGFSYEESKFAVSKVDDF